MDHLFAQVLQFSDAHTFFAYIVLFLFTAVLEGEITLLLAGMLSHQGYLSLPTVLSVGFAAALVHDIVFWSLGKKMSSLGRDRFLFINLRKVRDFLSHFHGRIGTYIFTSKFTWGLSRMVLISSGYMNISLRKLLFSAIPASFAWSVILVLLGYFFSYQFDLVKRDIVTAGIFIAIFMAVIILIEILARKVFQKRVTTKSATGN